MGRKVMLWQKKVDPLQDIRDTTARLERSERFFEAFIRQAPYVMWTKDYTDGSGRTVFVSDRTAELFGVERKDWEGKTDEEVFPPAIAHRLREHDLDILETGTAKVTLEYVPVATTPEWTRCHAYRWPIREDGVIIGVGGIAWPALGVE